MDDRHSAGHAADGLTARQKGDIYWKKLKNFLQAVKDKNVSTDAERKGRYMAKQLLARKKTASMEEPDEFIDGNEFKMRPPTSAGELAYEDSIWKVICNLNYFRSVLSKNNTADRDGSDTIVLNLLNELQKVTGETVEAYFKANGVNYLTEAPVSAAEKKKAAEELPGKKRKYEEAVKQFKSRFAMTVAGNLKDRLPVEESAVDMGKIRALIDENPDRYLANKAVIDNARAELESISEKQGRARAELAALKKYAETAGSDADTEALSFMDYPEIIRTYEECLNDLFASLEWSKAGCETCIRCLLADFRPDPFTANYMSTRWKADTETFSADSTAFSLPGYKRLEYDKEDPDLYRYETIDEIRQGIGELERYRDEHPKQFYYQMIPDVLFGIDELPEIAGRSGAIRNVLAGWAGNGYPGTLSDTDREELKDMWVRAETTGRVAEMVLEYHRESERRTIKDLIDTYLYDTQDMDYRLQEKKVRTCLDNWFSGLDGRDISPEG